MGSLHVAVVGAGAVGLSSALWLQKLGHRVSLIDPQRPGSGTSSGNACTIADYACIPVNNPGLLTAIPSMLMSRDSPLTVDRSFAIKQARWLASFLSNCRRSRVDHTIRGLGSILRHTAAGLNPLLIDSDSMHLMNRRGCLYVYETRGKFDKAWADNLRRRDQGVAFEVLDSRELQELEPNLKTHFYRGLLFAGARQTVNPQTLMDRFAERFSGAGGELIQDHVVAIDRGDGLVKIERGEPLQADKIVIAAGAFSTRIQGAGLDRVPLGTERGYHVQYAGRQGLLDRPVGWAEAGLYMTPTTDGLRFAGTVEIASLDKPANRNNIEFLTRRSKQAFDLEEQPGQSWLGFRPTLPDALPVIDQSACGKLLYAFGHQHVGLTLAGITGKIVAALASDQSPGIDLKPYALSRFR